jgi:hypothetical protein
MKLFELVGLFAFIMFVTNCIQFDKDRKRCEKVNYEASGCSIHKVIKEQEAKRLRITYK